MKTLLDKYTYRVEWSEEDRVHIGSCLEFPSLKAHGKTPEMALKQIRKVTKETITWMEEEGEVVPKPFGLKPFKGHLTLRTSSTLHRQLALEASQNGVSINQYILQKITPHTI